MTIQGLAPIRPPARLEHGLRARRVGLHPDLGFWLVIAGVVLSCLAGNWQYIGLKVPVDRVVLILGLCLEWGGAIRTRRVPPARTSGVLLLGALAWATLSWIGSPDREITGFYFLLDLFIVPTALFISAPVLFRTPRRRAALACTFTVFALYLGFTAVTQTLHIAPLVWPSYILNPSVGIHADRARGPYAEAVANGIMLVFSGTFAAYVAATTRSRAWRFAGIAGVVVASIGSALTLTRAIWFCAIASLVIAFLFIPWLRRRAVPVLAAVGVGVLLFLAVFPSFSNDASARGGDQNPIWDRLNVDGAAARMVVDNPLFGVGWYEAQHRMSDYIRLGADYPVTAASATLIPHNVFLGHFAELGILGGSLWLASLVGAVLLPVLRRGSAALRPWRVVLLSLGSCWLIAANFGPVNYSQPSYVLLLVGGLVLMGSDRRSHRHLEPEAVRA